MLAMPARLRTDSVRALLAAWQLLTLADPAPDAEILRARVIAFGNAYETYYAKLESRQKSVEIESLIAETYGGSWNAAEKLWQWFIDSAVESEGSSITGAETSIALRQARSMKGQERYNQCRALFHHLEDQIGRYNRSILYPTEDSKRDAVVSEGVSIAVIEESGDIVEHGAFSERQAFSTNQLLVSEDTAQEMWDALAGNIRGSAERIWRDVFLNSDEDIQHSTLSNIARISQRLMLLWLEAILYQDRSYDNFEARALVESRAANSYSTRRSIHDHVKEYHAITRRWDYELTAAMKKVKSKSRRAASRGKRRDGRRKKTYFRSHHLESQQLHRLIGQFSVANPEELGWDSQAEEAKAELRYQLRDEVRREKLADRHWIAALGLLILKITTGYGTRPIYFAYTALVALLVDSTLFFFNDLFHSQLDPYGAYCTVSQPHIQGWIDVLKMIGTTFVHYLYVGTTTLTTLGVDTNFAPYCHGWSSQLLLALSTAFGYFMLGLLGALLYTQLTQRD